MQYKEKRQGIIAGIALLIMAIVAGFSFGYVHSNLIVDSPEITIKNLMVNKSLFYAELLGWTIIFITDLIVAIALYFFFRSVSKQISMITAFIRIVYTLILGIAIIHLFKIVPILSLDNIITDQPAFSDTLSNLQLFDKIWSIGLIVFGLHLIGLGYLSIKSKSVPKLLGYLLYFGGISYTLLHTSIQLSLFNTKTLNTIENILALPMALAEILLAFWLLYNGFRNSSSKIKS
jgi:hypothetical protein